MFSLKTIPGVSGEEMGTWLMGRGEALQEENVLEVGCSSVVHFSLRHLEWLSW